MTYEVRLPPDPTEVSAEWDRQYERHRADPNYARHREIGRKLRELKSPTREEVEAVIGNEGWTRLHCDGGHERPDKVLVIDINCGEFEVCLCKECLTEMVARLHAGPDRSLSEVWMEVTQQYLAQKSS